MHDGHAVKMEFTEKYISKEIFHLDFFGWFLYLLVVFSPVAQLVERVAVNH